MINKLPRAERERVERIITNAGLNPDDFVIDVVERDSEPKAFDISADYATVTFRPTAQTQTYQRLGNGTDWIEQFGRDVGAGRFSANNR